MKFQALVFLLVFIVASCSNEADDVQSEPIQPEQSNEIKREFSVDREVFQIDSIEAKKTKLAGHPWLEISFIVPGFSEEHSTTVKIDVTADEEKHWIDPPLGDTTGAIVTLINKGEHVVDYYRPLKTGGKDEGFVQISNITDEFLDLEMHAWIENAISKDSIAEKIELFATLTKVPWHETNIFGMPLDEEVEESEQ